MGRRGPKPAPNHLKVIKGTEERYLNRDEPIPEDDGELYIPPMTENARKIWDRLAPDMIDKKVLTNWDVDAFAMYCEARATAVECIELLEKPSAFGKYIEKGAAGGLIKSPYWQILRDAQSMMAQLASRFGLTPGDRANLKVDGGEEGGSQKNGAERILG